MKNPINEDVNTLALNLFEKESLLEMCSDTTVLCCSDINMNDCPNFGYLVKTNVCLSVTVQ